jgi:hypothetical protein
MKTNKSLLSVGLLLSSLSFAGSGEHGVGNGGNAIVCFDNSSISKQILSLPVNERTIPDSILKNITSIQALDLYEAQSGGKGIDQTESKDDLFEPLVGEKTSDYLNRLAARFSVYVPEVSKQITKGMSEFAGKVSTHGSNGTTGVAQVYDFGQVNYVIDKERCVLSTVANQTGLGDKLRLDIDSRLFDHPKHSNLSQKVLMLHEVIYLWGRKMGHGNSRNTITLVGALIKSKLTREEVIETLVKNGFFELKNSNLHLAQVYPEESVGQYFLEALRNDTLITKTFDQAVRLQQLKNELSDAKRELYRLERDRKHLIYERCCGMKNMVVVAKQRIRREYRSRMDHNYKMKSDQVTKIASLTDEITSLERAVPQAVEQLVQAYQQKVDQEFSSAMTSAMQNSRCVLEPNAQENMSQNIQTWIRSKVLERSNPGDQLSTSHCENTPL